MTHLVNGVVVRPSGLTEVTCAAGADVVHGTIVGAGVPSRGRLRGLFVLAIVLTFPGPRSSSAEPTLEEVRAGYSQTIEALFPIWTHCKWSKQPIADEFKTGPFAMAPVVGTDVEWAIDGDKWHFSHRSDQNRRWISYDGSAVWELTFDKSNVDVVLAGEQYSLNTRSDFVLRIGPTPGKWLGMYFGVVDQLQSGATLRQMLNAPNARLQGEDEIDGHSVVRIDVSFPTPGGDEFPVSVWLDPAAGFLPRRIETRFSNQEDDKPDALEVQSFRQITTASGTQTWFPERMSRTNALAATDLILLEITAGAKPGMPLFRPTLPRGAPVFDMESVAGIRAQAKLVAEGDVPRRSEARGKPRTEPTPLPAEIMPAMPAHPHPGYTWPRILMFAGLVLLVAASWQLFRDSS